MKLLYVGLGELYHTADRVYITGMRENGAEVVEDFSPQRGIGRYTSLLRSWLRNRKYLDCVVVGYAKPRETTIRSYSEETAL